ncbi:hypothetical protein [Calothrix sp. PCC 7507]|uniref:hypothetical protein n=1 Tax=Calothrix sp. PCC 7507 TaxID=99598 RepID=UPI00029EF827|nr:hypothetical protein [Calothrix sp. PCC 7507]AFY36398.1 hypothetical protein Cal7507_6099 [Calothrix sp. PCC 7507]
MINRIASLAALAVVVASPLTTMVTFPAQAQLSPKNSGILIAQANQTISVPVEVTNISALKRVGLGGHTAKVSYRVSNLPAGFKLNKIKVTLNVRLRDGELQRDEKEISSSALQGTVELRAPGKVVKSDEEVNKVQAFVRATATRNFNGFILGKANANNLGQVQKTPSSANQFPLNVDITKLSNLERNVGGGHKIDVRYAISNRPTNVSLSQVRVKAKFILDNNSIQEQTDVLKDPNLNNTVNVRARGSAGRDGEVKRVEVQVAADGIQTIIGNANKEESATQAQS